MKNKVTALIEYDFPPKFHKYCWSAFQTLGCEIKYFMLEPTARLPSGNAPTRVLTGGIPEDIEIGGEGFLQVWGELSHRLTELTGQVAFSCQETGEGVSWRHAGPVVLVLSRSSFILNTVIASGVRRPTFCGLPVKPYDSFRAIYNVSADWLDPSASEVFGDLPVPVVEDSKIMSFYGSSNRFRITRWFLGGSKQVVASRGIAGGIHSPTDHGKRGRKRGQAWETGSKRGQA